MDKVVLVARILLGLVFFVFGLNGFLDFIPPPQPAPAGGAFLGALGASGYMFPLLKATEAIAGALLLAGFLVPLALTVLAPIVVNIFLFHLVLDPGAQGLGVAIVVLALEIFLAWSYRGSFQGVLNPKAKPTG
jgi:uncharacterized membrane protein YphA (DoxX/SURF4 family)